ncbi:tyrosine-type recombinase/integrase [Nannocystaceae bacterium ST9]
MSERRTRAKAPEFEAIPSPSTRAATRRPRAQPGDSLNAAQRRAGLGEKGPHTLRHTFCSHLAMTGAHVMEIKTLAGHSKLETTQRYMHLTPRALRGAVDRLEGAPPDGLETTRRRRSALGGSPVKPAA